MCLCKQETISVFQQGGGAPILSSPRLPSIVGRATPPFPLYHPFPSNSRLRLIVRVQRGGLAWLLNAKRPAVVTLARGVCLSSSHQAVSAGEREQGTASSLRKTHSRACWSHRLEATREKGKKKNKRKPTRRHRELASESRQKIALVCRAR